MPGLKVPHMGWNQLAHPQAGADLPRTCPRSRRFISCIRITCKPKDRSIIATETDYPTPFTSAIWHDNVLATQFHPEKSQKVGLAMLRNFVKWK